MSSNTQVTIALNTKNDSSKIMQFLGNLASKFISPFKDSTKPQVNNVSTTANLINLLGLNQASNLVEDSKTDRFKGASFLPNIVSEFADIVIGLRRNLIPSFVGLDKRLDPIQKKIDLPSSNGISTFITKNIDIVPFLPLTQVASILRMKEAANSRRLLGVAQSFLSDTRIFGQVRLLDLYEKSTTFRNELERIESSTINKVSQPKRFKDFHQPTSSLPDTLQVLDTLFESIEGLFISAPNNLFDLINNLTSNSKRKYNTLLTSFNPNDAFNLNYLKNNLFKKIFDLEGLTPNNNQGLDFISNLDLRGMLLDKSSRVPLILHLSGSNSSLQRKGIASVVDNWAEGLFRNVEVYLEKGYPNTIDVFQQVSEGLKGFITNIPGFNLQGDATSLDTSNTPRVGVAASGLNYQGLLNAAIRESRTKPSGSGLVVANTSEVILNRQQQAALFSSLNKGGGGLTIGSITIQTQATDARGIAKDIMKQIAYEFNNFSQNYVTAPVN